MTKGEIVLKVIKDVNERYGKPRYINLGIYVEPSFTRNPVINYDVKIMLK